MVLSGLTLQRVISRPVLIFLAFVVVVAAQAQPIDVAGTMPEDYLPALKEILNSALRRSPETIAREFEVLASEARVDIARGPLLPQAGGNFNYGATQTATASDTSSQTRDSGFFYNFGVSQAVFHWGALKNQADAARISLLVQQKSFVQARRDLNVKLRSAYLALIAEKARIRQVREALRLLREDVAITKTKRESGAVSPAALASDELRLRESVLELNRAELEFANNRGRFVRLAGLPPELPEDQIADDIPRPTYSESVVDAIAATLLRDNAKSTLEFEIYDLRLREAQLHEKIEATRLWPKFNASANYSLENTTNVNGNLAEQRAVARQSIGIAGQWNIFDGFATRGAKREAFVAKRALEYQKTVDIDRLLQSAQALQRALKFDAEQLELTDIRRGMAVEGHKRVTEEVGFGFMAKGEVARAKLGILQTEARSLEARATFLARWSEFVALAGGDPVLQPIPARHAREKK